MTQEPDFLTRASLYFAAGGIGGAANSFAAWFFGVTGVNTLLGISLTPAFTPGWLYLRVVWGGIWGLLFLLPLFRLQPLYIRATFLSLIPCAVQLLIVFPLKLKKGYWGLELGTMTPLLILALNLVWGYTTALWLALTVQRKPVLG
ncbi:MAG: hypothetical protein B7Z66_06370 [Chromatiales bacterium 21-64-14]|nr:MAG: hypothetical protein B7Z66_06370 [Chromatiales bacterium 21-64-14]HQU15863.1 hypothetical protein [Gammaproteobacteria bacterium]